MRPYSLHSLLRLALLLCFLASRLFVYAQETSGPKTTYVFRLKHKPDGFSLFSSLVNVESSAKTLANEPALGKRNVIRGDLRLTPKGQNLLPFIWDSGAAKLYLDLNRNGDLSDDPVFESSGEKRMANSQQEFKNVVLPSSRGPEFGLWNVDIWLWTRLYMDTISGVTGAGLIVHSGWEGEVVLYGRKLIMSVVDGADGLIAERDTLALRDAGKSYHPMYEIAGVPKRLFFGGHLYEPSFQLEPGEKGGVLVAQFRETESPLGECRVVGQHIARLVLSQSNSMVAILDEPSGEVAIPVGTYDRQDVFLDGGSSVGVFRTVVRTRGLRVFRDVPVSISMGAPLRNSVKVEASVLRNMLRLGYELRGADGEIYDPYPRHDPKRAPKFAIYGNNKKVGSGSFAYG